MFESPVSFVSHLTLIALLAASSTAIAAKPSNSGVSPRDSISPRDVAGYGKLPLSFEINRGQTDPSVQFLSHGRGYTLFLRQAEAVFAFAGGNSSADTGGIVRLDISGANPEAAVSPEDEQGTKSNYFLGSDPGKWRTGISNYSRVRYTGIYPGIDLVYYGNQGRLEHDFVVAPNADPARIVLQMQGAQRLSIDSATGDLVLTTGAGEAQASLRLLKPITYQELGGTRRQIPASYKLLADNRIGFSVGHYNHARQLVIDPILVYSTYLGGSGAAGNKGDQGNGIGVNSGGAAFIVGTAYSTDFPVSNPPLQSHNYSALAGNSPTVFVSKLNPAGNALIYSTYLGGSGGDFGYGIAIDAKNDAYITGATYSADFPVTCGVIQPASPSGTKGASAAFVAELNPAGNALIYSTYLGGQGNQSTPAYGDAAQAIAVSPAGNAYVTGYTWSSNFPVTDHAFQPTFAGSAASSNAFVSELNPGGTALVYSTYLGGSGSASGGDLANALVLDASGDAYVAGSTSSANFPVVTGALQASLNGASNAFVTELNPDGSDEVYSTYLGGNGTDSATAIAIDGSGSVYLAGSTSSSDFPLTVGALEGAASNPYLNQWGQASFVTKLNLAQSTLTYSTYLEGINVSVAGLAVDHAGSAYLAGTSPTLGLGMLGGFQSTPDALPPPNGGNAAYVVKLDPTGTVLNFATLFGGSAQSAATAISLDPSGNAYVTGSTASTDFTTTAGAMQTTNKAAKNHGTNAFVSKFVLGAVANQMSYNTTLPATIATTLVGGVGGSEQCYPGDNVIVDVGDFQIVPAIYGPPPTGQIYFEGVTFQEGYDVTGTWGDGGEYTFYDGISSDVPSGYFSFDWSVSYSGDSLYSPSYASGTVVFDPGCPDDSPDAIQAPQTTPRKFRVILKPSKSIAGTPKSAKLQVQAAKFILPAYVPPTGGQRLNPLASTGPSCAAPGSLTVTLNNASRLYGAPNSRFTYTVTGLVSGNAVTVIPVTPANSTSHVGSYPIYATVSGADSVDYKATIQNGTLSVLKAPLNVEALNVSVTYGQKPPALTSYGLTGFVNGDTASVVTGAPVLTSTVTATTPVGFYPITIKVGTLSAVNYSFDTVANGEGLVGVYKAALTIHPANVTIRVGDPLPTSYSYTLSGFVNGDTQLSATTGAPAITTNATSSSGPGRYYIIGSVGTLKAANYTFTANITDFGTLTIEK